MSTFSKPSRSRIDPAQAEAFIAGADVGPAAAAAPAPAPPAPLSTRRAPKLGLLSTEPEPSAATAPPEPEREPEVSSQTVRFTAREKAALQHLARSQRRSEHFILKEILTPALLAALPDTKAS